MDGCAIHIKFPLLVVRTVRLRSLRRTKPAASVSSPATVTLGFFAICTLPFAALCSLRYAFRPLLLAPCPLLLPSPFFIEIYILIQNQLHV